MRETGKTPAAFRKAQQADCGGDPNDAIEKAVMPVERPAQLEEIAVVERAPDGFPELVLGHAVDAARPDETGIVATDELGENEGIGMPLANAGQNPRPEIRRHRIGRIEPPAGSAAVEPVTHDCADIGLNLRICAVERHQTVVPLEGDKFALRRVAKP